MKRLERQVAATSAAFVAALSLAYRATPQPSVVQRGTSPILLNEILFDPGPNQSPFVELINSGAADEALDGASLVNHSKQRWSLPAGLRIARGAVIMIAFDGRDAVEN